MKTTFPKAARICLCLCAPSLLPHWIKAASWIVSGLFRVADSDIPTVFPMKNSLPKARFPSPRSHHLQSDQWHSARPPFPERPRNPPTRQGSKRADVATGLRPKRSSKDAETSLSKMMALMVKAVLFGMEKCEVWPEVIGTGKMQTLAPDFHGSIQFASVSIASRNLPQHRHAMNKSTSQQKMDCPHLSHVSYASSKLSCGEWFKQLPGLAAVHPSKYRPIRVGVNR